jgi:hypothetical protein
MHWDKRHKSRFRLPEQYKDQKIHREDRLDILSGIIGPPWLHRARNILLKESSHGPITSAISLLGLPMRDTGFRLSRVKHIRGSNASSGA